MKNRIQSIDEHTWIIEEYDEINSVYMYLLEGKSQAVLLDTGFGTIPLDKIVRSLTDKPCRVINTHGHFDHIGGNYMFDDVSMHILDQEVYELHSQKYKTMIPECRELPVKQDINWFDQEMEIDLGDRTLQIIHTPGHSKGCICVLDVEAERIFTGDTCCKADVLLIFEGSTSVETYSNTIQKLMEMSNQFSETWPSHHTKPVSPEILNEFQEASQNLLNGEACGIQETTPFGERLIYYYKNIGIAYKKIYE